MRNIFLGQVSEIFIKEAKIARRCTVKKHEKILFFTAAVYFSYASTCQFACELL